MEQSGNLAWKTVGRTGHLIINNPPRNFITTPSLVNYKKIREWFSQPNVDLILVYGQGRHFSAGADLTTLTNKNRDHEETEYLIKNLKIGRKILDYIEMSEKPVIAVISGSCLGAGLEIALACHMRIVCENSFFGFPEISYGIIPGLNGIARLSRIIGKSRALLFILSGELIDVREAEVMGLTTYVVPKENFWNDALRFTEKILTRKSKAVRYAMQSILNIQKNGDKNIHNFECRRFAELVEDEFCEANVPCVK